MTPDMDDLDRILISDEPPGVPANFVAGVMEAVEYAAAEPPPLSFPWRPFGTGVLACLGWSASGVWLLDIVAASAADVVAKLAAVRAPLEYAAAAVFGTLAILALQRTRRDLRVW
jgi:hypothetical protein